MKIDFMRKADAETIEPNDSKAMISIRDKSHITRLKSGWKNLLVLEFDDIDPDELRLLYANANSMLKSYNLFSDMDAQYIKTFVDGLDERVDQIYVHCFAGRSRSPAIAKVLAEKFETTINENNINPNMYIYNKLKENFNK